MADLIVDQGLNDGANQIAGLASDPPDAMAVSNFGTLLTTTTTIAAAGSKSCVAYSGGFPTMTPVALLTWRAVFTVAFPITTITNHNDGAGVFTGVQGGVDSLALNPNNVPLTITLTEVDTSI